MTRRHKYNAKRVHDDGEAFDSKAEHRRYCQLKQLELAHEIEGLEIHPSWSFTIDGVKIGKYIGDFAYYDRRSGERIVEDVKGVRTAVYRLKKKLMLAIHGIEVVEIDV